MVSLKYLMIFGLVIVTWFGLSKAGHTRPLQCLECFGEGENAREDCEKNIVSEDCGGENEVCGVGSFKTEDGYEFHRGCITIEEYNENKAHCTANPGTCAVAMCKTSNCKPEFPSIGGQGLPLQCLDCFGEGENAREDCEKNMVSEICEGKNMVCEIEQFKTEDGYEFHRGCMTKRKFKKRKSFSIANPETCVVGMCKTSNCKPELPYISGN